MFTEYGITMLARTLKSEVAVKMSLKVVNTFIMMRKYISHSLSEQQYFNRQIYYVHSKLLDLMIETKNELIIIDGYSDKKVLDMIRRLKLKVLLITKENSLITKSDIKKYNKLYDNLKVVYDNTFHGRYLILDKKILYHLGSSINYAGSKTILINRLEEKDVIKLLMEKVNNIFSC